MTPDPRAVEAMTRDFHASYERLAPEFGHATREASAASWEDVFNPNHALMLATIADVLTRWTLIGPEQQAALAKGEAVVVLEALAPIVTISGAWRNWKGEPYWRATGGTARRPRRAYDVTGPTLAEAAAQAAKQERARLRGEGGMVR